jgi:Flp pilus assembly protein TadG
MSADIRGAAGRRSLRRDTRGQSLIEAAMVIPVVFFITMGVVEIGVALRNQLTVAAFAREGSNLISRDVSLTQASNVLKNMASGPIDLNGNTRVIFSVVRRGAAEGTTNYNKLVVYQRYEFGSGTGKSRLKTKGSGSFNGAPDYEAKNSDTDSNLQLTNAPSGIVTSIGGLVYVTEVISPNNPLTNLLSWGVSIPTELYSIAYF